MVHVISRSISLPLSPAGSKQRAPACHVRSISLPCRSHPLLSHLHHQILALSSQTSPNTNPHPTTSISSSLVQIHTLLSALANLLLLPDSPASLRNAPNIDRILDAFLLLADSYGMFRCALVSLKQATLELQAAIRRGDSARLASALRSQRRTEKELAHLASSVREAAKCANAKHSGFGAGNNSNAAVVEMVGFLAEAVAAAAAASTAVFLQVVSLSVSAAASLSKKTAALVALIKRKDSDEEKEIVALERLVELEECVGDWERQSELVFRSLVQSRVSLLNIQTHTFQY